MKIVIYGAYGYQGRLVLAESARHDTEIIVAGRDAGRLTAVAGGREIRTAAITDHDALTAAFRGADAVINCAGPFSPTGTAVARAAIAAGCHYTDTSGEQLHVKNIYDTCAADAERAGVIVTPGMTDSGVPGDLLARLLADRLGGGPLHEIMAGHRVTGGGMSRGSIRSLLGTVDAVRSGGLAHEDGQWRGDVRPRRTALAFPGDASPEPVARFALHEVTTVPRHTRVAHVQGFVEAALAEQFSGTDPAGDLSALPEGPDAETRRLQRWAIAVEATTPDGRRATAHAEGPDTYGTTAVIAATGTLRLTGAPGVRAPAEVLRPAAFLDALAPNGVTWTITEAGDHQG